MASSQVQISSSSSSPFGCVLRNHNRRDRFRDPNVRSATATHISVLIDDCGSSENHDIPLLDRWAAKQLRRTLSSFDPMADHQIPTPNSPPVETSKRGASSLVQIWEKRLNHSSLTHNASNSTAQSRETGDFEDEDDDAAIVSDDSFSDWNLNRTTSSSPQSRNSDAGESERVRVADIIRKLAAGNQSLSSQSSCVDENDHQNESTSSVTMQRDQGERKSFNQVISSPRIRGRQAFADLLMQLERDRQRELDRLVDRRAVSKFGQRGRIQSLLRLRILKRGMAVEHQQQQNSIPSPSSRCSTIMHLRERFARVGDNGAASRPLGDTEIHNLNVNNSKIQSNTHAISSTSSTNVSSDCNEEASGKNVNPIIDTVENPISQDIKVEVEAKVEGGEGEGGSPATSHSEWLDHLNLQDSGASVNEAAEEHDSDEDQQCVGTSYDWFTHISRPRSYWEDRRQTWYREMLDSNSVNDDIRQLIKRKTVFNFLCSDFRERMDQLMVSRLDQQTQKLEEEEEVYDDDKDREEELWCVSERGGGGESSGSDDEEGSGQDRHEGRDYMASPSVVSSWSYEDNEIGDESNREASMSSVHHFQSEPCSREKQEGSLVSTNHTSIEMGMIYDLRGQMEQLYHEMSELRKSIKSCMEMQQMLQESNKREAGSGLGSAGRRREKERSRESKCCICLEMQVDSLLYRCGHMCSCMGCGKELQWSGGKCPICGAAIQDVVRAYPHSSHFHIQ